MKKLTEEGLRRIPHKPGIYFLYNKEKILMYIGKSVDLRTRIAHHFNNAIPNAYMGMKWNGELVYAMRHNQKNLSWVDFSFYDIRLIDSKEIRKEIEKVFIRQMRPRWNIDFNSVIQKQIRNYFEYPIDLLARDFLSKM